MRPHLEQEENLVIKIISNLYFMSKKELFSQLEKFIFSSNIPKQEKKKFLELFVNCNEEELDPMIKLFQDDFGWIEKIYQNYKAKKQAFKDKDKVALENIFTEELEQLQILEQE